jgi:hypothetical protein
LFKEGIVAQKQRALQFLPNYFTMSSSDGLTDDVIGEDNDASLSDMKKIMDMTISDGSGKKKSYWAGTLRAYCLKE